MSIGATKVEKQCGYCQILFMCLLYDVNRGKGKFCSNKCNMLNRNKINYLTAEQTFYKNTLIPSDKSQCWLYQKSIDHKGYAHLKTRDIVIKAHRFSYKHHIGEIPNGLFVCHKCDVRNCVNPNHLFLGTNQDNMNDMCQKGRKVMPKGIDVYCAKLDENQVKEIKLKIKEGMKLVKIASIYNVSPGVISHIKNGLSWKHINI